MLTDPTSSASAFMGILLVITSLYLQSQTFVDPTIRAVSIQSFVLAGAFALLYLSYSDFTLIYVAVITLVARGIIIPWVMLYQVRRFKYSLRENARKNPSFVILGVIIIFLAYVLFSSTILPLFKNQLMVVPLAIVFLGLLLIITRRNALMQLAGFLEEENAVLYLGGLLSPTLPLLIEFAVVLDILGVILVGVILSDVRGALKTLESPDLEELKG
ncbi:MAG: hypothetical protein QXV32_05510 [Conexivisphaerales archaeon]